MTDTRGSQNVGFIALPLRGLAVGSLVIAIMSLTTLVIIVSISGVDTLSTVALALAILAFVIQIIVYIVQSADTSAQARRSQELHSQLIALLAEIQERTSGTQRSMESINARLLEAVIGKAQVEGLAVDTPEFARSLASTLASVGGSESVQGSRDQPPQARWPKPLPPLEAEPMHREMQSWPPASQASEVESIVGQLKNDDLVDLIRFADDLVRSTRPGAALGPGLSEPNESLRSLALTEKVPGWKLHTLTPKGRLVGRLFTAPGERPVAFATLGDRLDRARTMHRGRLAVTSNEDPSE